MLGFPVDNTVYYLLYTEMYWAPRQYVSVDKDEEGNKQHSSTLLYVLMSVMSVLK